MNDWTKKVREYRTRADTLTTQQSIAKATLKRARAIVIEGEAKYDAADEAQQIVQAVAEMIQEEAHDRIAGVVSQCLAAVFDKPYEFQIRFERARGRTEARLVFVRGGMEINPIDASGGGVVDVAAFALRLSCLMLARPACRRVMVLDEPFRFVPEEYREHVRIMLEDLAKNMSVQFIMVTHIRELTTGHVVEVNA